MNFKACSFAVFIVVAALLFLLPAEGESKPALSTDGNNLAPTVICKLPPARGHCRALLPRWRYDPNSKKCHEFKFGGCDGNGNNFMSQKACMAVCGGV